MKRKFDLLKCETTSSENESCLKKNSRVNNTKRCRETVIGRQCWAEEDVDCDSEVVKKGYGGNRKVIYNFVKMDVSKVPTYIL